MNLHTQIKQLTAAINTSLENHGYVAFLEGGNSIVVPDKESRSTMMSIANRVSQLCEIEKLNQEPLSSDLNEEKGLSKAREIDNLKRAFINLKERYETHSAENYTQLNLIQKIFHCIYDWFTQRAVQKAMQSISDFTQRLRGDYFTPINVANVTTHGSRGILVLPGLACAHASYGGINDKLDKQGRNCDQMGFGVNSSGLPCAVVADGSGTKLHALIAATCAVTGCLEGLAKKELFGTNSAENIEACKGLLLGTLDSAQNTFWQQDLGNPGDDPQNWGGSTTVSVVSTVFKDNKVYVSGGVLGDAVALYVNKTGVVTILACAVGDPAKNVNNAGGQLRLPTLGQQGGFSKNAKIVGFTQEMQPGDKVLLASDFLSDNIASDSVEEFQDTLAAIIKAPLFDNYETACMQLQPLTLNPEDLFSSNKAVSENALKKLKKPKRADFQGIAANESEELSEEVIVKRLNNYARWINEQLTVPVMDRLKLVLDENHLEKSYPELFTIQPTFPLNYLRNDSQYNLQTKWLDKLNRAHLSCEQTKALDLFLIEFKTAYQISNLADKGLFGKSDDSTLLVFDPFNLISF